MSYLQIFAISAQGMDVEKLRLDVVANNIANQHATQASDGSLFQAQQVISHGISFDHLLNEPQQLQGGIAEVELSHQALPAHQEYQPGHPAADAQGFVRYPGVNMVDEMSTLLRASRAYEANIKMLNMARSMALQALSIGDGK